MDAHASAFVEAFKHPAFAKNSDGYDASDVPWLPHHWWNEVGKTIDKFIEATDSIVTNRSNASDSLRRATTAYEGATTWVPNGTSIDGLLLYARKAVNNIATVSTVQPLPMHSLFAPGDSLTSRRGVPVSEEPTQGDAVAVSSSLTSDSTMNAAVVFYAPSYCKARHLQQTKGENKYYLAQLSSSQPSAEPVYYSHTDCSNCRSPRPSSSFKIHPTLLQKSLSCEQFREVFASKAATLKDPKVPAETSGGGSSDLGSKKPQSYLNTGGNIFFNRRPDAAALGFKGRHHALHEGKLIGVAQGQLVTSLFPLPYSWCDIPGSILLSYHMKGRYMRYAPAYLTSEFTATTTFYHQFGGNSSQQDSSDGIDMDRQSTVSLSNGLNDARISGPVYVQDGEIESSDVMKYVTFLVDAGNSQLQLHLYSPISQVGSSATSMVIGGAPVALQRRAVIYLNSLLQVIARRIYMYACIYVCMYDRVLLCHSHSYS
jgi:hypothetical protein